MSRHPAPPPAPAAAATAGAGDRERALARLAERPWRSELFVALRRIEALHPDKPRLGNAARPADEPVRLAQEPALTFAPAAITALEQRPGKPPRLVQRVFGLLGPNGPLPTHLTEFVHDRQAHQADPTLARFLDMLQHRFGLLFYRAWADAQPVVTLDRPDDRRAARHLGALCGLESGRTDADEALSHDARLFIAPRLARAVRDADGLQAWVRMHLGVPARVRQWNGHWMRLGGAERTRLARHGHAALGHGAVLGSSVWDVQHAFRIEVGPLDWDGYGRLLPGAPALLALREMVRQYVGFEFEWDLRLVLAQPQVPRWRLGDPARGIGRLGRSCWLGRRGRVADDLVLHIEKLAPARAGPVQPPQGVTP